MVEFGRSSITTPLITCAQDQPCL